MRHWQGILLIDFDIRLINAASQFTQDPALFWCQLESRRIFDPFAARTEFNTETLMLHFQQRFFSSFPDLYIVCIGMRTSPYDSGLRRSFLCFSLPIISPTLPSNPNIDPSSYPTGKITASGSRLPSPHTSYGRTRNRRIPPSHL